jgi:hypothetical protein
MVRVCVCVCAYVFLYVYVYVCACVCVCVTTPHMHGLGVCEVRVCGANGHVYLCLVGNPARGGEKKTQPEEVSLVTPSVRFILYGYAYVSCVYLPLWSCWCIHRLGVSESTLALLRVGGWWLSAIVDDWWSMEPGVGLSHPDSQGEGLEVLDGERPKAAAASQPNSYQCVLMPLGSKQDKKVRVVSQTI